MCFPLPPLPNSHPRLIPFPLHVCRSPSQTRHALNNHCTQRTIMLLRLSLPFAPSHSHFPRSCCFLPPTHQPTLTHPQPTHLTTHSLFPPCPQAAAAPRYGSAALSAGLSPGARTALASWLGLTAVWVYSMVVLGGITRLTRSGLSMTEWKLAGETR